MTRSPDHQIALAAALDLPDGEGAPDWVHLLPAGGAEIRTFDGRGPYRVTDQAAVIAASWPSPDPRDAKGLLIDENHAQDKAAPIGLPSPARGHIVELQARDTGIWGRVAWTEAGRGLVADRAYGGISPVFLHDRAGKVLRILRASLVNNPNLQGLTALNQETPVTFSAPKLAAAVGLSATATEDEILAALPRPDTALQSAMTKIAAAVKVDAADPTKVAAAVEAGVVALAAQGEQSQTLTALQAQIVELEKKDKRRTAEAWLAGELAKKRAIPSKDHEYYITLHMEHPDIALRTVGNIHLLGETHTGGDPPGAGERAAEAMDAEQQGVQLAAQAEAYQKKKAAEGISIDFYTAVRAVSEAKQ